MRLKVLKGSLELGADVADVVGHFHKMPGVETELGSHVIDGREPALGDIPALIVLGLGDATDFEHDVYPLARRQAAAHNEVGEVATLLALTDVRNTEAHEIVLT